jgi:hypothetical protein
MVVETIKNYLEIYKQEKNELVLKDDELAIRELVANYEKEVRANFAEKKAREIATKDSEIVALQILISRIESDEAKKRELEKQEDLDLDINLEEDNSETNIAEEAENVLGDVDLADL